MYGNNGCGYGMNNNYAGNRPNYNPIPEEYSPLEKITAYESKNASVETVAETPAVKSYSSNAYKGLYLNKTNTSEERFLNPTRPVTPVIKNDSEIMKYVKDAFKETTGKEFPEQAINFTILSEKGFKEVHEAHNGIWSPEVKGFAINRNGKMRNEIFVKQDNLDRLMLTIGHEIGHVMNPSLYNEKDEEAKAFAFSMAWMEAIKQKNIAGIGSCINPRPAKNGIHDAAFEFVLKLAEQGKKAMQIFDELSKGKISIAKQIEVAY